jgi:DNA-binding winged helix-turn-helix (wHTH) protein
MGTKLNWIICSSYGLLNGNIKTQTFEKIVNTNIVPLLPHNEESIYSVVHDYIDHYGKISLSLQKKIVTLSGGNPGILKALFLLAQEDKLSGWSTDINLTSRLTRILDELTKKELSILQNIQANRSNPLSKNLVRFGYIKENTIFSPIVQKYFPLFYDESGTHLSTSEKLIFQLLKRESPAVVSRDEIAKLVWKSKWTEKYSDWAIDQIVHDIREKLVHLKSPWTIKTKRNGGYYIIHSVSK